MSRTENPWLPGTPDERLDRIEALDQIRQLPSRYALALDTRNFDDMVKLFVPDVQVGKQLNGRDALRSWFCETMSKFGVSIHFVGNHTIDFQNSREASGVVYCQDQLEVGQEWQVGFIQYWDQYENRDGIWYFKRRRLHRWYMVDAMERPRHGARTEAESGNLRVDQLPDAWPSWAEFWQAQGKSPR